jgi:tetratricopeptide (TPR) repeat protein
MRPERIAIALFIAFAIIGSSGCVTDDGTTTSGWVVIGDPGQSSPRPRTQPDSHAGQGKGLEKAARNHIRSAYRFLKKDKPDHALRELEKARRKMDRTFWYHYYMGGAYYMKGMYGRARDSWELAYRFTRDYRLRSRIRTCQSFVVFRIQGYKPTIGFLRKAVDMDRDNGTARGLLDDLYRDRDRYEEDRRDDRHSSSAKQPAFVGEFLDKSKYGDRDDDREDDRDSDRYRDRDRYDDDDRDHPGKKDKKYKEDKPKKDKEEKYKGKKPSKKPRKKYRVEDDGKFRAYFFIQMP